MQTLKSELLRILRRLAPECKYSLWVKSELKKFERREAPDSFNNSFFEMAGIADLFKRKLKAMNPALFTENNSKTQELQEFITYCHQQVNVIPFASQPNESEENMMDRVMREEMTKHYRKRPNHKR